MTDESAQDTFLRISMPVSCICSKAVHSVTYVLSTTEICRRDPRTEDGETVGSFGYQGDEARGKHDPFRPFIHDRVLDV